MTSLNGATVLVTGANGGLGTALVTIALERGAARVYAAARTSKEWSDARVVPLQLDLTDPASIEQAAATADDTTILVNNAAIFPRSDLLTGPVEDITTTLETNLVGPIPAAVAAAVYDALDAGEHELLVDDMTRKVHGALSAPVTALYPTLAAH